MVVFLRTKNLNLELIAAGYRPEPDKSKISYNEKIYPLPEMKRDQEIEKEKIDSLKREIEEGKIQVRPFSDNKWSKYSYKKSTYMLAPNNTDSDSEKILEVEQNIVEEEKDPRNIDKIIEEEIENTKNNDKKPIVETKNLDVL